MPFSFHVGFILDKSDFPAFFCMAGRNKSGVTVLKILCRLRFQKCMCLGSDVTAIAQQFANHKVPDEDLRRMLAKSVKRPNLFAWIFEIAEHYDQPGFIAWNNASR